MEEKQKHTAQGCSANYDFLLEYRLRELNEDLSSRYACSMSAFERMLDRFRIIFPTYTDHSLLHTMNVANISNQLLRDNIQKLNAGEIYVYLMACALHDVGMCVSDKNLDAFIDASGLRDYADAHQELSKPDFIRKFHNEFSAQFVKKYWSFFEIPNEQYARAIAEVGRGHRKTDLMDETLYPVSFALGDGQDANIALLAALIRLCDELDIASDRNPKLLYDTNTIEGIGAESLFEFAKHNAIHSVAFTGDSIVIMADTDQESVADGIIRAAKTVRDTFTYCLSVIETRSDIKIDCQKMTLILNNQEIAV
ncbi:MAG: hypothetical protein IKY16_08060 [Bacteroidales bacterium]|nr:hypothetical protein [Bacteroidales bacterium]